MKKSTLNSLNKEHQAGGLVSFAINFLDKKAFAAEEWLYYELELQFREQKLLFKSIDKTTTTYTGSQGEIGKFAFAIKPYNELEALKQQLKDLISGHRKALEFESVDPSLQISIAAVEPFEQKEFKVYLWIDAGNSAQLEYSWDAIGIRFICDLQAIEDFYNSL
jgi:hypothetical protein